MSAKAAKKKGKKKKDGAPTKRELLALQKKEVINIKTPGISAKQRTYESKFLPKHYMPNIMEKRLHWNLEIAK